MAAPLMSLYATNGRKGGADTRTGLDVSLVCTLSHLEPLVVSSKTSLKMKVLRGRNNGQIRRAKQFSI